MACGITCDDAITPSQAFRKLIGVADGGCPALRVQTVTAAGDVCDQFVTCDNMSEQEAMALFYQMIDATDPDCWVLNVIDAT